MVVPFVRGIVFAVLSVLLLGLVAIGFSGCSEKKNGVSGGSNPKDSNRESVPELRPLFEGWKKPAVAILLSGELNGYLEPCGCSPEFQLGGLSYRADLVRTIREDKKWPFTAFDLGNIVLRDRLQDKIKFRRILQAFSQLDYRSVSLGTAEIRLGADHLLLLENLSPENKNVKPAYIDANIEIYEDAKHGPRKFQIHEVNNVKIAVTAIVGEGLKIELFPEGTNPSIKIQNPLESLQITIVEMKKHKPDLLVLLSHASQEETRGLIEKLTDFDLVLTAGGPEDGIPDPEKIGKTMIVNVGKKGKHVGVVGYFPDDKQNRLRFQLIELDRRRFQDHPQMTKLMQEYQQQLEDNQAQIFDDLPRSLFADDAKFVGAQKCAQCHTKAYGKWKTTKHAQAYESLLKGRKDTTNWVPRQFDPECLACHVTGWDPREVTRYDSGFLTKELSDRKRRPHLFANLKGQQCENCHGPGSLHTEIEERWQKETGDELQKTLYEQRRKMKLTLEQAKSITNSRSCYRCHDGDNSPKFEFEKYWKEIVHKGRD